MSFSQPHLDLIQDEIRKEKQVKLFVEQKIQRLEQVLREQRKYKVETGTDEHGEYVQILPKMPPSHSPYAQSTYIVSFYHS